MKLITGITQRILWIITLACMKIFCNFYVSGKENLKGIRRPLMIVANHRSYWDALILGALLPFSSRNFPVGFIADDGLFSKPLFKFFFAGFGVFPANRGKGLDISLRDFRKTLAENRTVIIFPYGRRIYGDHKEFGIGRGAATLVQEFGNLTILPVFLRTTPGLSLKKFLFGKNEMGVIAGRPYNIPNASHMGQEEISKILVNSFLELNERAATAPVLASN